MIVKRVTDISDVLKIIPIEIKLREKEKSEMPVKDVLSFLNVQMKNPLFAVWMVTEGEQVKGYACTVINPFASSATRDMMIWRIWYDQHNREAMNMLEAVITSWAHENKVKKFKIEVKKGIRALNKTWGFLPVSVIMERRV